MIADSIVLQLKTMHQLLGGYAHICEEFMPHTVIMFTCVGMRVI